LLYTGIVVFGTLGVYSLSNSVVDVLVMYLIGVLGFFMRRFGFPVGPTVLGVILMPLLEAQFRRALSISQGDPMVFFTRPLSAGLLLLALLALLLPFVPGLLARLRGRKAVPGRIVFGEGKED
jgi:putative tricarboxylic transport membrane protein